MIKKARHGVGNDKDKRDEALVYIDDNILIGHVHPKMVQKWLQEHKLTEEFTYDVLRHCLLNDIPIAEIDTALKTANIDKSDIDVNNVDNIIDTLLYMNNEDCLQPYTDKSKLPPVVNRLIGEYGREKLLSDILPLAFGNVCYDDIGDVSVYLSTNIIFNTTLEDVKNAILRYYNNDVMIYDDDNQDSNGNYMVIYDKFHPNVRQANLLINEDNSIEGYGRPFTHRDIPAKISIGFPTAENNFLNYGGVDSPTDVKNYPWDFEQPCSNMEWNLRDSNNL